MPGVVDQDAALRQAAEQALYNTSLFTPSDLRARANRQQLTADFQAYFDGFSPSVQDILDNFEFRNQIPRLSRVDALDTLIEKLTSPDIDLSPDACTTPTARSSIPASTTTAWTRSSRSWCTASTRRRATTGPPRRGPADGEVRLPAHRRPDQLRHPAGCTTAPVAPAAC